MDKDLYKTISIDKLVIETRLFAVRKVLKVKRDKYFEMVYDFGYYCYCYLSTNDFDGLKAFRMINDICTLKKVIDEYNRQFNDLLFESKRLEKQLEDIRNG